MSKIRITDGSPLARKEGESLADHQKKLLAKVEEIIDKNMTNRYSVQRLAYCVQELPIDFTSADGTDISLKVAEFLANLDDLSKKTFRKTYLAHKPEYESHLPLFFQQKAA